MKGNEKKKWEKDRRDRLKEAFGKLEKLLPCYDPSNVASKIKIIEKTTEYIQELRSKIDELLKPSTKLNAEVLQLKRSQDRIKRLLTRIELLTNILKEAKISIPKEGSSLKQFSKYKWSGKINEKTAVKLQKRAEKMLDSEKENKKVDKKTTNQHRKVKSNVGTNVAPKHRKTTARKQMHNVNNIHNVKRCLQPATSNCVIIYTQACNTQPCYLVTNATHSLKNSSQPVLTNQFATSTPLMSTEIKSVKPLQGKPPTLPSVPNLGTANTLILTNVLPQSQPVLPTPIVLQLTNSSKDVPTTKEKDEKEKNVECSSTTSVQKLVKDGNISIEPKICVKITGKVPIPQVQAKPNVVKNIRKERRGKRMKSEAVSRSAIRRLRKIAKEMELEEKRKQKASDENNKIISEKSDAIPCEKIADTPENLPQNKLENEKISIISNEILKNSTNEVTADDAAATRTSENELQPVKNSKENPNEILEVPEKAAENLDTQENRTEPVPVSEQKIAENVEENMKNFNLHSELSNDIFASLQVPTGCQNPESTSPTAAFLLAFPLVSSLTGVKVTEVIDEDNPDSQRETPTLLQIGTIESKQTQGGDNQNLINLDNLSFLSKDIYNSGFYNSFEQHLNNLTNSANNFLNEKSTIATGKNEQDKSSKEVEMNFGINNDAGFIYENKKQDKNDGCNKEVKTSFVPNRFEGTQKNEADKNVQSFDNFLKKNGSESLFNSNIFNNVQSSVLRNVKSNTEENNFQVKQVKTSESLVVHDTSFLSLPSQSNFPQNPFNSENNSSYAGNQKNNYNYLNYPTTHASKPQLLENKYFKDTKNTLQNVQNVKNYRNQQNKNTNFSFNLDNKQHVVQKDGAKQTYPSYLTYTNYDCTKVCTFNGNKMFPEPLYTNSNNSNYNYYTNSESYPADCYKSKGDKNVIDFENFNFIENNFQKNTNKSDNVQQKPYNNWMTTPKTPIKEDNSYNNYNQMYFTTPMYPSGELGNNLNLNQTSKKLDLSSSCQKDVVEENQFSSWSPTKIPQFLDPVPNFSTSLPTLVGDLALGTSTNFEKPKMTSKNYENNQSNFFSVSQLVHNKDVVPSKTVRRRNSGASSKNAAKSKKLKTASGTAPEEQNFNTSNNNKSSAGNGNNNSGNQIKNDKNCRQNTNVIYDNKRNLKVNSSSYSAEALIAGGNTKNQKNNVIPPFIPDNFPYFPPVDLQQENYMQQNQNYQNFNTYSSNNFITTPYLSSTSTNFMPQLDNATHEFAAENMNFAKSKNKKDEKHLPNAQCNLNSANHRKVRRKPSDITPNFVDFSFLSVPGNINSPLLPDDFHTHANFLPPPPPTQTLYPCKNTLYPPKQASIPSSNTPLLPLPPIPSVSRTAIQHTGSELPLNNVGTSSLTNFNLSTIFPEINKGSMNNDNIYNTEGRTKEQQQQQQQQISVTRHYSNSTTISFNSQPIFTYPNCQTTQSYGIDQR